MTYFLRHLSRLSFGVLSCVLLGAGCAGMSRIDHQRPAFAIWHDKGSWHLQVSTGGKVHRYQGTITGPLGGVTELLFSDAQLKDHAALTRGSAQFDFERAAPVRIDVKVAGRCASFDLYVDGQRQPERVYLGSTALTAASLPIMLCPGP